MNWERLFRKKTLELVRHGGHAMVARSFLQLPPEPVLVNKVVPDSWADQAGFEGGAMARSWCWKKLGDFSMKMWAVHGISWHLLVFHYWGLAYKWHPMILPRRILGILGIAISSNICSAWYCIHLNSMRVLKDASGFEAWLATKRSFASDRFPPLTLVGHQK